MSSTEPVERAAVSVVGLGKLGACMAAVFAAAGARVIGVDVQEEVVARLARGEAPVEETGLAELVQRNAARLEATLDTAAAVRASELTFVIVPTPSQPDGSFSLSLVQDAFRAIGEGLRDRDGWHTVVLTSTVLPGSVRHGLVPVLEAASGKRCGEHFGVCYSPAFIALGSVIHNFTHPDFVLIGESDARAGAALEAAYRGVLRNGAPCRRMSLENAELAKVALNTFVTLKISFANMLAELCERLPGGDVDVVTDALGLDRRVGRHYLRGGTAYGGPCFPRDNRALASLARTLGVDVPLAESTDHVNHAAVRHLADTAMRHLHPGQTALVLGLAYKPGTWVTEESAGVAVAQALHRRGVRVLAWDPLVAELPPALAGRVERVASLGEGVARASVVLVTLPDAAYRELGPEHFVAKLTPTVVLDCWRLLRDRLEDALNVRYVAVGLSVEEEANQARLAARWAGAPEVAEPGKEAIQVGV